MTKEELRAAFADGRTTLTEQMQRKPPLQDEAWQAALLLASVTLLEEFLVDHKRIADAMERLASTVAE